MDNSLVDRETLARIIDALIAQKFPGQPADDNLKNLRELSIATLDAQLSTAIFARLSNAQLDEVNQLFDRDESDPQVFRNFFMNAGVDLEQTVATTLQNFSTDFLRTPAMEGGLNA